MAGSVATGADGFPWCGRDDDFVLGFATLTAGADRLGLHLPDDIMPVFRTEQSVGNFVQDGVADQLLTIERDIIRAERDSPQAVIADAAPGLGFVQLEMPALDDQTMLMHQGTAEALCCEFVH